MLRRRSARGGSGIHPGGGRGHSLDFYGHSPYVPGDDVRRIDWLAYARTGGLYVKDFSEERQATVTVLLDSSASMDFGNPGKWEFALKLSLGLAYLALRQGDSLTFCTFASGLQILKENARGMEHFYDLAKMVPRLKPAGIALREDFTAAGASGPGIIFVLSDFLGLDAAGLLDLLCLPERQAALLQVLSPQELEPFAGEELKLVDAETGGIRRIHFTAGARRRYLQRVKDFLAETREQCIRRRAAYVFADTGTDPVMALKRVLEVGR
jgi:uncharacterized protein (DUF58 family)